MNIKIDMSVCRVCLKSDPGTNIHTGDISAKFQFSTLLQVEKNDGLPDLLCRRCLSRLQIAYDFRKQAEASNQHIRSFLTDVNKRFQQVTGEHVDYEELEELQEFIHEEQDDQETPEYDLVDPMEQKASRDELVEILSNNAMDNTVDADADADADADSPIIMEPQSVEMIMVDNDTNSSDPAYLIDHDDDLEFTEEVYLEEEDEEYEVTPVKRSKGSASNPNNRCHKCNKTFSTRTNLTRHLVTHGDRKPYVCKLCGNAFTQNGSLKSHMYTHTGEKPFQCNQCDAAFTQSKSLTFHMRRHTGEKPFQCNHCGIHFRQKDGLKRHIIAKHTPTRDRQFECNVCNKVLMSKPSLAAHRSKHDPVEIELAEMIDNND